LIQPPRAPHRRFHGFSCCRAIREDFAALLEDSFTHGNLQGRPVIKGTVVGSRRISRSSMSASDRRPGALREFNARAARTTSRSATPSSISGAVENALGEAVLSRDKAQPRRSWGKLEKAFQGNEKVTGVIFNQVKGGFTVDSTVRCVPPRSQVDIRPIRDVTPLASRQTDLQIWTMESVRAASRRGSA